MSYEERIALIQKEMRTIAEAAGAVHCYPTYTVRIHSDTVDFQYISYGRLMCAVTMSMADVMGEKLENIAHRLQVEFMRQMNLHRVESMEEMG